MSSIFRITDPITSDDDEHFEYEPVTGTNINSVGDIRINIETEDLFTHPSESFLLIEGRLTKLEGTAYANADNISLTNNAMMYLFRDIWYELLGQEIERINNLVQVTTMLGLLKYSGDFSNGSNQLWYKDTTARAHPTNTGWNERKMYIINNSDPKGTFSFRITLKQIFGFCEDYDNVVYGLKHTLALTRTDDNNAIFRSNAIDGGGSPVVASGKITLSKISWFIPHVTPADKDKMELYKIIERTEKLPVGYRMIQCTNASIPQTNPFSWRLSVKSPSEVPRFIKVGFQTDKNNNQEQNPAIFDNVNVRNIYAMLNFNLVERMVMSLNLDLSFLI